MLFAPCNFNSLNKLAAGIADNLAMIGSSQLVSVALSRSKPQDVGQGMMMAPTDVGLAAMQAGD